MSQNTDIAIIGAGASGLAAAVAASKNFGGSITLIEKLPRVGKKILSTGNGRCNLSNKSLSADKYSGATELLNSISEDYVSAEHFFGEIGLAVKCDSEGRLYPHSMAASSVLDALRFAVLSTGVNTVCDYPVKKIIQKNNRFVITNGENDITAKRVIIAAGGCATPSLGSDGSGYNLAKAMGHHVTHLYPALAPLRTDVNLVKAVKGLRTSGTASLIINGEKAAEQSGEVQFTDGALSGICIFNLSAIAAKNISRCEISLDITPELTNPELFDMLSSVREIRKNITCDELLTGLLHKRIGQAVIKAAIDISFNTRCNEITDRQLSKICRIIKDWRFPIKGVSDWSLAQITAGGISGNEINGMLESKIISGLYFCGEIIDLQGLCGGYNLEWAWKSGFTAGQNAALSIIGE